MTELGIIMEDVLSGREVRGLTKEMMERVCEELGSMTPRKSARVGADTTTGPGVLYKLKMVSSVDQVRSRKKQVW